MSKRKTPNLRSKAEGQSKASKTFQSADYDSPPFPDALQPYIRSLQPDSNGEWLAQCLYHDDHHPSFHINFEKGVFHCKSCGAKGRTAQLIELAVRRWNNDFIPDYIEEAYTSNGKSASQPLPTEEEIVGWHKRLLDTPNAMDYLLNERCITEATLTKRQIGYIPKRKIYTIPIRDRDKDLLNVRFYNRNGKPKSWGITGHNGRRIWPEDVIQNFDEIVICAGEMDCLALQSHGFDAVTSTGGESAGWEPNWGYLFNGRKVYILYDCDETGRSGAIKVAESLSGHAEEVRIADLDRDREDGFDATKWFAEGRSIQFLRELIEAAPLFGIRDRSRDPKAIEELERQRNREWAREQVRDERLSLLYPMPSLGFTLADDLAKPTEPQEFTIQDLHPRGSNTLLAAQYKAGKTTLLLNLMKSLVDGEPFLGRVVEPPMGRVAFLNYEMTESQFLSWLRKLNIRNPERATVWNLRGEHLPFTVQRVAEHLIGWVEHWEVEVLIIDPFAQAFADSGDENSNHDVAVWLKALDAIKKQGGVEDLFLSAHFGRNREEERARGATRLDDWADVRWTLTKAEDARYLSAGGRDVFVPEFDLSFSQETLEVDLGTRGGTRRGNRLQRLANSAAQIVATQPGINKRSLSGAMKGRREDRSEAIALALELGFIRREFKEKSHLYFPIEIEKRKLPK